MKPFAVVCYDPNASQDFRIPNYAGAIRHAWFPYQKEVNDNGQLLRETLVYFCDDMASCEALADACAKSNPGRSYGAAAVGKVFHCRPGPVVVTKFTEKGLLPA